MIGELLQWWYIGGWHRYGVGLLERLRNSADFFSIGLLLKTLFAPFRQISANGGANQTHLQAWLDKLFSRIIGAIVRIVIILAGIIVVMFQAIFGIILMVAWPVIPLIPIASIGLAILGVTF